MIRRKPILTISDLSHASEPALRFSGSLAHILGADLQVIHGVGLLRRPLRSVLPALGQLSATIDSAEQMLISQIRRTVPRGISVRAPAVELDDADTIIRRYTQELEPMVIVAPHLWECAPASGARAMKSPFALSRRAPPTVVVRGERTGTRDHVMVVSSVEAFRADVIEDAGRWAFWLERVYGSGRPRGPDFEVVLVDEQAPRASVAERLMNAKTDLIVVDRSMFGQSRIAHQVEKAMSVITKLSVPVALIAGAKRPRGALHETNGKASMVSA
jgi:hypothetical protein